MEDHDGLALIGEGVREGRLRWNDLTVCVWAVNRRWDHGHEPLAAHSPEVQGSSGESRVKRAAVNSWRFPSLFVV
jgi:hypothetical protein